MHVVQPSVISDGTIRRGEEDKDQIIIIALPKTTNSRRSLEFIISI